MIKKFRLCKTNTMFRVVVVHVGPKVETAGENAVLTVVRLFACLSVCLFAWLVGWLAAAVVEFCYSSKRTSMVREGSFTLQNASFHIK